MRIDCKATVAIGDLSRGGLTRGDHRACDHDLGLHEKYIPCGIVEEDSAQLHITFRAVFWGILRIALERDEVGQCRDDAGVGEEHDLEGWLSPMRRDSAEKFIKRGWR